MMRQNPDDVATMMRVIRMMMSLGAGAGSRPGTEPRGGRQP